MLISTHIKEFILDEKYIEMISITAMVIFVFVRWFFKTIGGKLDAKAHHEWVLSHEKKHDALEAKIDSKLDKIEGQQKDIKDYIHKIKNDMAIISVKNDTTINTILGVNKIREAYKSESKEFGG